MMTRECDERMWNLAYRLAQSGEHQNYQAIEWELRAFGYPRAPQLLCHERVREAAESSKCGSGDLNPDVPKSASPSSRRWR